ncbi:MAG: ATP-binding protein [Paracoccus sp. (in: a-proteobacteria)]|uniref:two-component system sensor histidine kinase NtrB n=1 Tax=Paracoccus sp. TaxID=267 RepID=UPI0026DF463E|nr:ATP-binding protein [Paracoccus sp. (in: a-proteobacteria)]MDO5630929.1 ATP-binding protein [Paracoccus sp. (in: a-proteobacteria)]
MTPAAPTPVFPGAEWEALPLPALILDAEGRVLAINEAAEVWLNLSRRSLLGQRIEDEGKASRLRIAPSLDDLIARAFAADDAQILPGVRFDIGDRAGRHRSRVGTLHAARTPRGSGVTLMIVPDSEANQRKVKTAARSAIGMAEMLAHEIKNPLAGIRGAAQLMAMNASPEDREMAEMIVAESRRIVSLLDQVERFGDTSPPHQVAVNVHDVLERVRRSALAGFARGLTLVAEYDPSLPPAMIDADQMTQVCLNLVKNAAEAISASGTGGTIRLRSLYDGGVRLTGPVSRPLPLQIEIEDDGPGLPPEIADQVFEPFVSGRENGTGLGLALVSKIITDHGAAIRVESRPGRTVFRISLPKVA